MKKIEEECKMDVDSSGERYLFFFNPGSGSKKAMSLI